MVKCNYETRNIACISHDVLIHVHRKVYVDYICNECHEAEDTSRSQAMTHVQKLVMYRTRRRRFITVTFRIIQLVYVFFFKCDFSCSLAAVDKDFNRQIASRGPSATAQPRVILHRVSEKNCANFFLSELRKISTNFGNF